MRVITEERLLNTLFAEIQSVALANGTCHYEGYKTWCISGEEVEQAIKNIFAQNDLFKPTVNIMQCKDCRYWIDEDGTKMLTDGTLAARCNVHNLCIDGRHYGWCPIENDFCSYGERKKDE